MDRIINEINQDLLATKSYLIHVHRYLSYCTAYKTTGSYGVAFQGLYEDFYFKELINGEWGYQLVSLDTRNHLRNFHINWREYVAKKPFGDDFFVFYDKEWHELVNNFLLPALESLEKDILKNDLKEVQFEESVLTFESYKNIYNPKLRPTDEELIWKVTNLYQLLLDKRIISKPFMAED